MNLVVDNSKSNRPLIKTSTGALQKGRWWYIAPDAQHFIASGVNGGTGVAWSNDLVSGALAQAKAKTSWTTLNGPTFNDFFLGCEYCEDYPYFDPAYQYSYGYANILLYSFTVPTAVVSRTIRSVIIEVGGGGATMLRWGYNAGPPEQYFPQYADPWAAGSILAGFRFMSSKPSGPSSVSATPHTNAYFADMTNAATGAGANIVYDSSGIWTCFDNGYLNVSTPTAVKTLCQGLSKIWLCAYAPSGTAFGPVSNFSRVKHLQNARSGVPYLWIYA